MHRSCGNVLGKAFDKVCGERRSRGYVVVKQGCEEIDNKKEGRA